ncbi:hypothetical protein Ahia01_000283600, partial [Argonauta hians]
VFIVNSTEMGKHKHSKKNRVLVPNKKSGIRKSSTKPITTNLKKLAHKAKMQTDSINDNIDEMRSIMLEQKSESVEPKIVTPPVPLTHTTDKDIEEVESLMSGVLQS